MASQAAPFAGRTDRRAAPITLVALILGIALLAVQGIGLAIATLSDSHARLDAPAVGHPVGTSYGSLTVVFAETLGGLTAEELGGMVHGVQNLVLSDSAQVEVAVRLANDSPREIRVSPAEFRLLVAGTAGPVAPTGTTIESARLAPGTSIEAAFTFVIPQEGQQLAVAYTDPGTGSVVTVPVGVVGTAPAGAGDGHH